MFYIWLIITIALSIIEMMTVNLVSIWFVISGILAMLSTLFTDNITIQLSIFVLIGTILMLLTRKTLKKIIPTKTKTNIDRIIGMKGIVTQKITKNVPGEVKVDGKLWTAIADKTIKEDTTVEILEINSTKIKVKEMEE